MYRLRQIALVAERLEPWASALAQALDTVVAYRDPEVGHFGLENAIIAAGGDFIEIVTPVRPEASAARYRAKQGDGGYMVILECADAFAAGAHAVSCGRRAVHRIDRPSYRSIHFHPADFGGVIVSVDTTGAPRWRDRLSPWPPAGPDWIRHADNAAAGGLLEATLAVANPQGEAARWAEALGLAAPEATPEGARLALGMGTIAFLWQARGSRPGLAAITLGARDPDALRARARAAGLPDRPGGFACAGLAIDLAAAPPGMPRPAP